MTEPDDNQLVEAVRNSAHLIWQAGLGAFSRAQEEGDKVFENLINAGSDLQKRMHAADDSKAPDVTGAIGRTVDMVGKQAADSWDKIEHAFEDRLARALHNIGVPTHDDIKQLAKQVEELRKLVEVLPGKRAVAAKGPAIPTATVTSKEPAPRKVAKSVLKAARKNPAAKTGARPAERKRSGSTA